MKGYKCDRCKEWFSDEPSYVVLRGAPSIFGISERFKPGKDERDLCKICFKQILQDVDNYQVVKPA